MQASANVTATCYDSLPHPQLLLLPVVMRGRYLLHYCYCHMLWQLATPSATVTSSCNERPPPILHLLLLSHAMKAFHTLSYCYFQLQWMAATSSTTVIATCYDSLPHPQLLLLPVAMNCRHLLHLLLLSHAMKACHLLRYFHFQWGPPSVTVTDTYNWTMDFWHLLCFCYSTVQWKPTISCAFFTVSCDESLSRPLPKPWLPSEMKARRLLCYFD